MGMNNDSWIFKDGVASQGCMSFPYAFRMMFNAIKKGVETGRKYDDMVKQMVIIAPTKDQHGDPRRYNYTSATDLAKSSGLLNPNGEINSREFGKKR